MTVNFVQRAALRGCATLIVALAGASALANDEPAAAILPPAIQQALQAAQVPASAVSMLVLPVEGGAARLSYDASTVR